jgi:hypothetical protein
MLAIVNNLTGGAMQSLLPGYYITRRWGQSRCYEATAGLNPTKGLRVADMRDVTSTIALVTRFDQSFMERLCKKVTLRLSPYDKQRNFLVDLLLGRPRLQIFEKANEARRELQRQQQLPGLEERARLFAERIALATLRWICHRARWLLVTLVILTAPAYGILSSSVLIRELLSEESGDR